MVRTDEVNCWYPVNRKLNIRKVEWLCQSVTDILLSIWYVLQIIYFVIKVKKCCLILCCHETSRHMLKRFNCFICVELSLATNSRLTLTVNYLLMNGWTIVCKHFSLFTYKNLCPNHRSIYIQLTSRTIDYITKTYCMCYTRICFSYFIYIACRAWENHSWCAANQTWFPITLIGLAVLYSEDDEYQPREIY